MEKNSNNSGVSGGERYKRNKKIIIKYCEKLFDQINSRVWHSKSNGDMWNESGSLGSTT